MCFSVSPCQLVAPDAFGNTQIINNNANIQETNMFYYIIDFIHFQMVFNKKKFDIQLTPRNVEFPLDMEYMNLLF